MRPFPFLVVLLCLVVSNPLTAQLSETQFRQPAPEFRPKTWLHVMSENMSAEGMTRDLEAIAEVGIGGVLIFNVTQGIPVGKVKFNSEEHTAIMAHAAAECQRLGLTFGLHNCDGWSSSGGPWNTPENAMKMVVWADTVVSGDAINTLLPHPPVTDGFYGEIATLAWPARDFDREKHTARFSVSASQSDADLTVATDGLHEANVRLEGSREDTSWVQFSYDRPFTLRSVYALANTKFKAFIQHSEDGKNWSKPSDLATRTTGKHEYAIGQPVAPATARYFRFSNIGGMDLRELQLSSLPVIPDWMGRSAIARTDDDRLPPIPAEYGLTAIDPKEIIDLSDSLDTNGRLTATLPAGEWTIMRFGYTSTGAVNVPASATGTGPEVDKFRRAPLKLHYDAYVGKVVRASPPGSVGFVEIDSYEVGGQNWTQGFRDTFRMEYGYDNISWLPTFAGLVVDGPAATERVQGDLRRLNARLTNDNYYGYFTELANADGLKTYVEPYGSGPLDNIPAGGRADIPMGEFWLKRNTSRYGPAVSSGHVYGKNIISAEAFSAFFWAGNWGVHPAEMVADNDYNWTMGFNEYVFHRFAHQANTRVTPGMTMNKWGTHYDRTQTWWYNAGKAFNTYISRGQYLLRQGVPVADALVFVGDGSPNSFINRKTLGLPWQVNFDCIAAEALQENVGADAGAMKLANGTTYRYLLLKNSDRMSLKTLEKLWELAKADVPILGEQPGQLIGHNNSVADLARFSRLAQQVWARPNAGPAMSMLKTGPQLPPDLTTGEPVELTFTHRKAGDVDIYFVHNPGDEPIRTEADFRTFGRVAEVWNATNGSVTRLPYARSKPATFTLPLDLEAKASLFLVFKDEKAPLRVAEINPSDKALFVGSEDGTPVLLANTDRSFDVTMLDGSRRKLKAEGMPPVITLDDQTWEVNFAKAGGYDGSYTTTELTDWKDSTNDSIRYFSGTATYTTEIDVPQQYLGEGKHLSLDLGYVQVAAEVIMNGEPVATLWKTPYTVDITDYVKAGNNQLTVAVTNTWTNRLIGEERYPRHDDGYKLERYHNGNNVTTPMVDWYTRNEPLPPGPRTTFSTADFYSKDDPLVPSGLMGPVRLVPAVEISLTPAARD